MNVFIDSVAGVSIDSLVKPSLETSNKIDNNKLSKTIRIPIIATNLLFLPNGKCLGLHLTSILTTVNNTIIPIKNTTIYNSNNNINFNLPVKAQKVDNPLYELLQKRDKHELSTITDMS